MMGTIKRFEDRAITVAVLWALLLAAGAPTAHAEGLEDVREFHIEAQALDAALIEFSEQANLQLMVPTELVAGRQSPGISGEYAGTVALAALLDEYGLSFTAVGADTVAVSRHGEDNAEGKSQPTSRQVLMAQNQASAEENQTASTKSDDDEEEELELERVTVTGTHIRGIAPDSSPTRTYTREDIQITGAATAQDFIQTLTANFGGGSSVRASLGLPNDNNARDNGAIRGGLGSSVNLRGLGSGATLVLLNGQRLAPSSGIGDFTDISMIPASALERVEVLTDGASSIYGGDAVAGVVNFILRDDFDGAEASFRYGTVTEGDLNEYRSNITGGKSWNSGNALLVYEYFKRDDLSAADRSFSQSATLPHDLLPSEERHSVLGTASQELTSDLKINANLLFSRRNSVQDFTTFLNGDFFRSAPVTKTISASGSATWRLSNSWFVDVSGTYSSARIDTSTTGDLVEMNDIDSDLWAADVSTSGTLLNLPGGTMKLAAGAHYRNEDFRNFNVAADRINNQADRQVYAFFGEAHIPIFGPDNAVPGIQRFEINASGRFDHFSDFGATANPKVGVLWSPVESLRFRGSFSTSFNPPPLGRVGADDILVSAFTTSLFNSIFGVTAPDPSIADVIVITVNGTAHDLDEETSRAFTAGLDFDEKWGRHELALKATWYDIEFEGRLGRPPVPGNLHAFLAPNIAFVDPDAFPEGTVIFSPTVDQINDALSLDADGVINRVPSTNDPLDAEIINNALLTRNLAATMTSGIDVHVIYSFELDNGGALSLGVDGTYLIDFQQQAAVTTPVVELLNTLFNPVDLKLRGRVGYANGNGFAANLFVNYTDSYAVDSTVGAARVDSWATIDFNLSYDTGDRLNNTVLNNTIFRLSVINLFDEDPPSTLIDDAFSIAGYDPTNANPLGRFVAFEITKRF